MSTSPLPTPVSSSAEGVQTQLNGAVQTVTGSVELPGSGGSNGGTDNGGTTGGSTTGGSGSGSRTQGSTSTNGGAGASGTYGGAGSTNHGTSSGDSSINVPNGTVLRSSVKHDQSPGKTPLPSLAQNAIALAKPLAIPLGLAAAVIVSLLIATRRPRKLAKIQDDEEGTWGYDRSVWRI
ncbi:MAG: hypothetical protein ACYDCC_13925 [Actinomycetota bacterium]